MTKSKLFGCSSLVAISILACGAAPEPTTPKSEVAAPVPSAEASKPTAEPPKAAPKEEPAPPAKAAEAAPPTVKLVEAGVAPKRALRYKFKVGTTEYGEVDMKMTMAITMNGKAAPKMALPTIRMTLRLDSSEVTSEGDLRYSMNTERVEVMKDGQADPKLTGVLEKELASLVGLHGKGRVSPRGIASETELELPPGASDMAVKQLDAVRDSIRQIYVPLPEEEVGKGAKWDVTSHIPVSGAMMDMKMRYSLTALIADGVQADVETNFAAPPNQIMKVAALPPEATATLESMTGQGKSKVETSFSHLIGKGTSNVTSKTALNVAAQGEKLQMNMQSDIALVIRPGKAPAVKK
jgi:hypothetical protein